ncbi:uncharacterized protein BDZ83DRAFT_752113 [Colletotrichum acutatum]|uniref:Uncharacterized protein n=1 Tax=Glomerella acutata TaxID=27357 RepID=A0AAD8ULA6_GLOAC|nr:uncharacterized protein BDZ83DRAFT_752113 [Colletotrichum acutatum]KAK1724927.1 hypothetical protein BDZ83DRAFT_752113 [Colletotrichum acutatum]
MPPRGSSSRGRGRGRGVKATGGAGKRKRDPDDAAELDGIQKQRKTKNKDSMMEDREWTNQYYQGVSITDLHGRGYGHCHLITPRVPFSSPFACDGSIEVMSGSGAPGDGSVRLVGPRDYFGKSKEQVVLLANAAKPPSKKAAYEVVVIPTGATGASSIKREYPQIISFIWPEKKADKELSGILAKDEKGTYVDVLKKVFKEQLKAFDKSVIDTTEDPDANFAGVGCVLSPPMGSNIKSDIDGTVHFLDHGVLFISEIHRIFLPFKSLDRVMLVHAKDSKGKLVGLDVVCNVIEPFHEDKEEESSGTTMIKIGQVDDALFKDLKEYMEENDLQVMVCEQSFYDYKKGKSMTGFMPMMGA